MIVVIGGRYSGGKDFAEKNYPGSPVIAGYEERIRNQMSAGEDPLQCAERFLETLRDDSVLVLTEMGCGIVPADREERDFREMNGRVNCLFAEKAKQLVRVIAGVGQVIK